MKRSFCTYFDRNYLFKALSLIESLERHGGDYHLYAVCHDEISRVLIGRLGGDRVTALPMHEFERGDSRLLEAKHGRSPVEYYWTATPTIILRLLERHPEIPMLAYVDADLFFQSSPEPIFDEVGERSVLIHGHRFSARHRHLEADNGKYNVGMLCFRNDARAREVLGWWRDRCIEWCYRKVEKGKMGDQFYLNDWPERFPAVGVLQNPGAGVAPWNLDGCRFGQDDSGATTVDGTPLVFFHFHALSILSPGAIVPAVHRHYLLTEEVLACCYAPYAASLERGIEAARAVVPGFSAGLDADLPASPEILLMVKDALPGGARERGFSAATIDIGLGWRCNASPQLVSVAEPLATAARLSSEGRAGDARDVVSELLGRYPDLPTVENLYGELLVACGDPEGAERVLDKVAEDCPRYTAALSNLAAVSWGNGNPGKAGATIAKGLSVDPYDRFLVVNAAEICRGLGHDEDARTLYLGYLERNPGDVDMASRLAAIPGGKADFNDGRPAAPSHAASASAVCDGSFAPQFLGGNDAALLETLNPIAGTVRVVYFIGAHLFQEEGWMFRTFPNLEKVYLFEPLPNESAFLAKKYAGHPVVSVFDCAISDSDGTAEFNVADNGQSSSLLDFGVHEEMFPEVRMVGKTTVKVRTISSLVREHGLRPPDLLFIDAQGAEYKILSSIDAPFLERVPVIFSEVSTAEVYKGARTLFDVRMLLENRFHFVGFAPLHPHAPEHGNALFVNRSLLGVGTAAPATGAGDGPLVSVIVSAYNSEAFISECLDDLERQTIAKDTEVIVVDAASPQGEGRIVLERQAGFPSLLYVRTPARIGVYAAWNLALKLARGKYVTVFSTNDRLRPDAHEILARTLDDHPGVGLVYGDSIITHTPHETFERHTKAGEFRWPEYSFDDLLENCMVGPHPMWRRSVHAAIGDFDEQYAALGDQDFFIRVGERFPLLHIPEYTGLYWMSPEGLSNRPELASPEVAKIRAVYRERHKNRHRAAVPASPPSAPAPAATQARDGFEFTIVIPVFNNLELTRNCILSIAANSGDSIPYELVVVDNASTDGTGAFLASLTGDVRIISNRENLGFSKACNQGAAAARGRRIVFLNNDTIVHPGWLEGIRRAFESYRADICGAKLLYPDGTIQHAGVVFDALNRPYHLFRGSASDARYVNEVRGFRCVTAACMGVRADLFRELGGFDEAFRNGFEDVDFCLRAFHGGFRIIYTPECVVTHFESKTPGRSRFDKQNLDRLQSKWDGKLQCDDLETCRSFGLIAFRMSDGRAMFLDMGGEITPEREDALLATDPASVPFNVEGFRKEELYAKFHSAAGDILARRRRFDEAAGRYRLAVDLGHREALPDLGDCLAKAGRMEEALACYDAALGFDETRLRARIGMGTLALISGKTAESASWFREATSLDPGNSTSHCGLGMAAMAAGDIGAAIDSYGRALDVDPSNLTAIHELTKAAFAQGRFAEAEARIRKFLEFEPSNAHMLFSLAGICHKQGKRGEALDALDRLDLFSPGYDGAEQLRAQAGA